MHLSNHQKETLSEAFPQILFQKAKEALQILQKKDPSQFRQKKHNRCFICKKRRHFARNCPNKSAKAVRLIQHLQQYSILSDNEEVESIFSEQSEKDDHTTFILADSTDSDPDYISVISTIQEINHIRPTLPGPLVKISVIPSKFHKPVSVISFLDTGAQRSMLNPKILQTIRTTILNTSELQMENFLKLLSLPKNPVVSEL